MIVKHPVFFSSNDFLNTAINWIIIFQNKEVNIIVYNFLYKGCTKLAIDPFPFESLIENLNDIILASLFTKDSYFDFHRVKQGKVPSHRI